MKPISHYNKKGAAPIIEPQTGIAALVLIIVVFVLLLLASDFKLDLSEEKEDTSGYSNQSGSATLRRLNAGEISCEQCIKDCVRALAQSEEKCQARCQKDKLC